MYIIISQTPPGITPAQSSWDTTFRMNFSGPIEHGSRTYHIVVNQKGLKFQDKVYKPNTLIKAAYAIAYIDECMNKISRPFSSGRPSIAADRRHGAVLQEDSHYFGPAHASPQARARANHNEGHASDSSHPSDSECV